MIAATLEFRALYEALKPIFRMRTR